MSSFALVQSMFLLSIQNCTTLALLILVRLLSGVHCKNSNVEQNVDALRIGAKGALPFYFYHNGEVKGSNVKLIEVLSKKLNFKYKEYMNTHRTKKYEWSDLMGMVNLSEAIRS